MKLIAVARIPTIWFALLAGLFFVVETEAQSASPVLSVQSTEVAESSGLARISVRLSRATDTEVTVYVATARGSAIPGSDFYGIWTQIRFRPGQIEQAVDVVILPDNEIEPPETFTLRLLLPVGATIGAEDRATVTIVDQQPVLISIGDLAVEENSGTIKVPVSLSRPGTAAITVDLATLAASAIPGQDFYGTHQQLTFQPGQLRQYAAIQVIDDDIKESSERFIVRLFAAHSADIADATANVEIRDNDDDANAIVINVGDDIVALAASSPDGTNFRIASGVHRLSSNTGIKPRNNQRFTGEDGAIIDGENQQRFAFFNKDNAATGVVIENLEIRHFVPRVHWGAIEFDTVRTLKPGDPGFDTNDYGPNTGWTLRDLWVHDNDGDGIDIGSGARLINVRSNHNTWLGIGGHGEDIVIDGGELIGNSAAAIDENWVNFHAGGMKITRAKDIRVSNMLVAQNTGPGLWFDLSVRDATINNNLIVDNISRGIFYEISYGGLIKDNVVLRSGTNDPVKKWIWPAGILISTSTDVRVIGNYVAGATGGISVIDQRDKRAQEYLIISPPMRDARPYRGTQSEVHANIVCGGSHDTGVASDAISDDVFTTSRWSANQYYATTFRFRNNQSMSFSEWQSIGQDTDTDARVLTRCPDHWDPRN